MIKIVLDMTLDMIMDMAQDTVRRRRVRSDVRCVKRSDEPAANQTELDHRTLQDNVIASIVFA